MRILFLCTGNICRSPTAHWVMEHKLREAGITHFTIDSAGTHNYHAGEKADKRTVQAAKKRGYDMSKHSARKFQMSDFYEFDHILAMDASHLSFLEDNITPNAVAKIKLFLNEDVPDPYYGREDGFEKVLNMIERGCDELIKKLV